MVSGVTKITNLYETNHFYEPLCGCTIAQVDSRETVKYPLNPILQRQHPGEGKGSSLKSFPVLPRVLHSDGVPEEEKELSEGLLRRPAVAVPFKNGRGVL